VHLRRPGLFVDPGEPRTVVCLMCAASEDPRPSARAAAGEHCLSVRAAARDPLLIVEAPLTRGNFA